MSKREIVRCICVRERKSKVNVCNRERVRCMCVREIVSSMCVCVCVRERVADRCRKNCFYFVECFGSVEAVVAIFVSTSC